MKSRTLYFDIEPGDTPPSPPPPEPPAPPGPLPGTPKGTIFTIGTSPSVPKMGFAMTINVIVKNIGTGDGIFDILAHYAEAKQTYFWRNMSIAKGEQKNFSVGNIQPAKLNQNSIYANLQLVTESGQVFQDEKTLVFTVSSATAALATVQSLKRQKTLYQGNRFNVKPKWR